jgi:hypothetical protein
LLGLREVRTSASDVRALLRGYNDGKSAESIQKHRATAAELRRVLLPCPLHPQVRHEVKRQLQKTKLKFGNVFTREVSSTLEGVRQGCCSSGPVGWRPDQSLVKRW